MENDTKAWSHRPRRAGNVQKNIVDPDGRRTHLDPESYGKGAFSYFWARSRGRANGRRVGVRPGKDWVLPYYRDLGVVLDLGMTCARLALMAFAKAEDPNSGGRQMPSHWGHPDLNIFTGSSPVATQLPHATGIAYAAKLRGDDIVVWTSFGEGTANKGDTHEAMNFAGVHNLPVIFFCENNGYAISGAAG